MIDKLISKFIDESNPYKPYSMLIMLCVVGFCFYAYFNFALASDVDQKIKHLEEKVEDNGKKIDRVLLLQLAEAIRAQHQHICESSNQAEMAVDKRLLDSLQADYREIAGENYPLGECP